MAYAQSGFKITEQNGQKVIIGGSNDRVLDWGMHGQPIYAFGADGKTPLCHAWLSIPQKRCANIATCVVTGRCGQHSTMKWGGKNNYKGRTMAKTLPQSMVDDLERLKNDPQYLSLKQDINLNDWMLEKLYKDLDEASDPEIWEALKNLAGRLETLLNYTEEIPPALASLCRQMLSVIEQGGKEAPIREEIRKTMALGATLKKQEGAFLIIQAGMMTKEQGASLVTMAVRAFEDELALFGLKPHEIRQIMDNAALRIGGHLSGVPTRPAVRVVEGVPLEPIVVNEGRSIDGTNRGGHNRKVAVPS